MKPKDRFYLDILNIIIKFRSNELKEEDIMSLLDYGQVIDKHTANNIVKEMQDEIVNKRERDNVFLSCGCTHDYNDKKRVINKQDVIDDVLRKIGKI